MSNPVPRINGFLTDPPGPGLCKLRVKSDGTPDGTRVMVVDSDGRELELLGVMAVSWALDFARLELASTVLRVEGAVDTELDAVDLDLHVEGPKV